MSSKRRLLALVAAFAACGVVAAVAVSTKGTDGPGANGTRPSPASIRIGATSQEDLRLRQTLRVRVEVPAGFRGTAVATVGGAGERTAALADALPVTRPGSQLLRLPIRADAAARFETCAVRSLGVALRSADGNVTARATRPLPLVAPRCGRIFGDASIWNTPIAADAPVDKRSTTYAQELAATVRGLEARGSVPTVNTSYYSTPVYTVPGDQPRVRVHLDQDIPTLAADFASVPLPDDSVPAKGTDAHLTLYQPSTDTLWEFIRLTRQKDGWHALWGGKMPDVSTNPGHFRGSYGATGTSLALVGGLITQSDLARGSIDHALAMAIPDTRKGVWSLPAQRSDGRDPAADAIPQGARFRLDPSVDVDALDLPPFTAMLARAAQRYGIYVRDTSPNVTLYGQDPVNLSPDPWPTAVPSMSAALRAFPWDRLQVMQTTLLSAGGKPVAD
jgi:hypothetical protein